ncbi:hypothetical protein KR026_007686, partial [Drosophila bipectinata]
GDGAHDSELSEAQLSPEELRIKKKQERRERLKKVLANRFGVESSERLVVFQDQVFAKEDYSAKDFVLEDPETIVANFYEPDEPEPDAASILDVNVMPQMPDVLQNFSEALEDYGTEDIFHRDSITQPDDDTSHDAISIVSGKTKDPDTVKQKAVFLQEFDLPSFSDISEEHLAVQLSRIKSVMSMEIQDRGSFVNPLTGEIITSTTSSSSSSIEFGSDNEEQARDAGSEISLDLSDIQEFPETTLPPQANAQSALTFAEFTLNFRASHLADDQDDEDPLAKYIELEKITAEFLNDLLKEIVVRVEARNYENLLRSRFDKRKLLDELKVITNMHILERNMNNMLNNRMQEYFKRLKNNRVFAKLSPADEQTYYSRYTDALAHLDHLKKRLEMAKLQHGIQLNRVLFDLHSAQQVTSFMEDHLEKIVRKTLYKPDRDQLARIVESNLRAIASKRREISDTRLFLITRKHTLGNLLRKIHALDTVTPDLAIKDFIAIQNETVAIEKKIEERQSDLKKMRNQYLTELHLLQHNREKTSALGDKLQTMKDNLRINQDKQRRLRAKLYEVKLERTKLRKRYRDMAYKGGILSMPALMHEYDHTLDRLKEKSEKVQKLKESMKAITKRITFYEHGPV